MFLSTFLLPQMPKRKYLIIKVLEARGIEPLSSSLSTQTSTCLAGEVSEKPAVAPARCQLPSVRDIDLANQARSLRQSASLLSTFSSLAGVAAKTSRSITPRKRDLRDLRLFVLVRFFTRPTNHPRHAACASDDESKPVRPRKLKYTIEGRSRKAVQSPAQK